MALSPPMREDEPDVVSVAMGTHRVEIDRDTLVVTVRGMLTGKDMLALIEHFVRVKQQHGCLFILYDGRECTGINADARKSASAAARPESDATLRVAFGVPYTVRVMLNMLLRAQKVLLKRDIAIRVFEHEKEAREYLEKERERLRRELKNKMTQ